MDALFEAELWGSNTFLPRLEPSTDDQQLDDRPPFSRVKLDVLAESGFDLSQRTDCDRYLHSAERLLKFYHEKYEAQYTESNPFWGPIASIDYTLLIKDLEEYVIPYLGSAAHTPG